MRAGAPGEIIPLSTLRRVGGRRHGRSLLSSGLCRPNLRQLAQRDKDGRFTALLHHVSLERLVMAYWIWARRLRPEMDGVTWQDCGQDLVANLRDLHDGVHSGRYQGLAPVSARSAPCTGAPGWRARP